jgi:hypothetical protein
MSGEIQSKLRLSLLTAFSVRHPVSDQSHGHLPNYLQHYYQQWGCQECHAGPREKHGFYWPEWSLHKKSWESFIRKPLCSADKWRDWSMSKYARLFRVDYLEKNHKLGVQWPSHADISGPLHASLVKRLGQLPTRDCVLNHPQDSRKRDEVLSLAHQFPSDLVALRNHRVDRHNRIHPLMPSGV